MTDSRQNALSDDDIMAKVKPQQIEVVKADDDTDDDLYDDEPVKIPDHKEALKCIERLQIYFMFHGSEAQQLIPELEKCCFRISTAMKKQTEVTDFFDKSNRRMSAQCSFLCCLILQIIS